MKRAKGWTSEMKRAKAIKLLVIMRGDKISAFKSIDRYRWTLEMKILARKINQEDQDALTLAIEALKIK